MLKLKVASSQRLRNIQSFIFIILLFWAAFCKAQTVTNISGTVTEASTGKPISSVSIGFVGSGIGTRSDENGKYQIIASGTLNELTFSSVGFVSVTRKVTPGETAVLNISLKGNSTALNEVVVHTGTKKKYRNKDNPAVELIQQVINHKPVNRQESKSFLEYQHYERIRLSVTDLSNKFLNAKFFKKYRFLLDSVSVGDSAKKAVLPVYMSEKYYQNYHRKEPMKDIQVLTAHREINLHELIDSASLDVFLNRLYGDQLDLYENKIFVLTNQFLSPISDHAPEFYKFFINDTVQHGAEKLISVGFTPRTKGDLMFEGTLLVTMDGQYAVRSVEMGVNKHINLNFVRSFAVRQEFEKQPDNRYYLVKSSVNCDFGIFKEKKFGLAGERVVGNSHFLLDQPKDAAFYEGPDARKLVDSATKNADYWVQHRIDTLPVKQAEIYSEFDSLEKMPSYRRSRWITKTLIGGYADVGPVQVGPDEAVYAFNDLEGVRFSIGGRTTPEFNRSIYMEGFTAYGFKDQLFKYYLNTSFSFNHVAPYKFPNDYLRLSYQYDTDIPGQNFLINKTQSLLSSFTRGPNNLWMYNRTAKLEYVRDFENHFSFNIGFKHLQQQPADQLIYQPSFTGSGFINKLTVTEFNLGLRYAPHERIVQGTEQRHTVPSKFPIFTTQFNFGTKGVLNGGYNYANLSGNVYKRFYLSELGFTDFTLQGGLVIGQVPFPLLAILPANQTYLYDPNAFNMMNFMEFVTDRYVGLNMTHSFGGFILNKVPLLQHLHWREFLSFKIIYGSLSDRNNPSSNSTLYRFPTNGSLQPLSYGLGKTPYMEAGVGIGNIFKVIRVDAIKRFNYLNHPGVSMYGLRFSFTPEL